jgi:hypothetical protein
LFPFSVLWGLSSEVFIRGFISSLPQRAWDKKALLLLLLLLLYFAILPNVMKGPLAELVRWFE